VSEAHGDLTPDLAASLDRILGRIPAERHEADEPDEAVDLPDIVPASADAEPPAAATIPLLPARSGPSPTHVADAPSPAPEPSFQRDPLVPRAAATTPVTGWSDHLVSTSPSSGAGLRAPGRRPRVRRVTRVVRHVDPWSVFKLAMVFSLVGYLVMLTSGVLLWRVADSTGTLDNVERWFTQFGWETFELKGGEVFHNAWVIGLFLAVGLTGAAVLAATLFNLVSDIVGGIRVTVLEEEVVERTASSTRRYVVRRPPLAAGAGTGVGAGSAWSVDDPAPLAPPARQPVGATDSVAAAAPSSAGDWSVDD
jgi:hypothetical protein